MKNGKARNFLHGEQSPETFLPAYLCPDVPVFIISLSDQGLRRQTMVRRGVPNAWVEAFLLASDQRMTHVESLIQTEISEELQMRFGSTLLAAEIGCAMSHREASRWLAKSGHPMALVLEDDIVPSVEGWQERALLTATSLMRHANSGAAFVCHLGARDDQVGNVLSRRVAWHEYRPPEGTPELYLHIDPDRGLWRAHAYLISLAAAQRTSSEETKIRTLADDWGERRRLGLIDELLYTQPVLVGQDQEQESTIDPDGRRRFEVVTQRLDVHNPIVMAGKLILRSIRSVVFRAKRVAARVNSRKPYILR